MTDMNHTEWRVQNHLEIPIVWEQPKTLIGHANNFVVQFNGTEFILSFYQLSSPILTGTKEEQQIQLDGLTELTALLVGRASIDPLQLPALIEALTHNLYRYKDANPV